MALTEVPLYLTSSHITNLDELRYVVLKALIEEIKHNKGSCSIFGVNDIIRRAYNGYRLHPTLASTAKRILIHELGLEVYDVTTNKFKLIITCNHWLWKLVKTNEKAPTWALAKFALKKLKLMLKEEGRENA